MPSCLAAEGVNVILVSRTQADLDAARERIAGRHNVSVQVHAYDLSDSRNVDRLAAAHPDIDILVNNAGAIPGGDLQQITEDRWRAAWDLKVFGYINMCRRFYAEMRIARARRDRQHPRHGRRENGSHLHCRLYRERRADGIHQGARRVGGR